ncbi:MAG TPA: hypothetical protein DHW40_04910 [Microbacterium sp.]|nr:hypothetical protein [Microbacterium sp.]
MTLPIAKGQTRQPGIAGIPVSDVVRDVAALIALLVSLALPWSLPFTVTSVFDQALWVVGGARVEVILPVIFSVMSIATTYLARFGVFGARAGVERVALVRALFNAPYVVVVLVYVVLDAARIGDLGDLSGVGLGAGVAVGLVGALLAATPRALEVAHDPRRRLAHASFAVVAGTVVLAALTGLIGIVLLAISALQSAARVQELGGQFWGEPPPPAALIAIALLLNAAAVLPGIFILKRSGIGLLIASSLGIATSAGLLIAATTGFVIGGSVQSLHSGGYPLLWLACYAALATSPGVSASMRPAPELSRWFVAVRSALVITVVVSGLLAVLSILTLLVGGLGAVGFVIGILLCEIASAFAALIARVQLVSTPERSRTTVFVVSGGIIGLQVIAFTLSAVATTTTATGAFWIMPIAYLVTLALPALCLYAFVVPEAVRNYFALHRRERAPGTGRGYPTAYPTSAAQSPVEPAVLDSAATLKRAPSEAATTPFAPAPVPSVPEVASFAPATASKVPPVAPANWDRAADPLTPLEEFPALAADPELWPALARNPALYPELAEWLAMTGNQEVIAILRSRGMA